MPEYLERIKQQIQVPFEHLSTAQRLTMLMVFVLTIIGTTAVIKWAVKPEYAVLVSDMEPADTQAVISELKANKVPYRIIQDGRGVMVPRKNVYDYRLKLASKNLPSSTGLGYEIFDKKDIGISEFVQHVNYRRALEGELARTIQSMPEVVKARIHIVFPKERLFKEDQKKPTASVFLSLKRGVRLTDEQVRGITMIVSNSIEGLEPKNVTIVDDHGNILSKDQDDDSEFNISGKQLKLQMQVESYYEDKVQSMLDQMLGPGNAIVRVNAELDFRRIEKTQESYDPDNSVVLSEEVQSQTLQDTLSGASTSKHTITNYQLTKSLEHVINDMGSIKRISVAVMVNGKYINKKDENGELIEEYVPRTANELKRLGTLVKNAVGLDEERGDQIDVQNLPFENPLPQFEEDDNRLFQDVIAPMIQKLLIALLILGGVLIVRSKLKKAHESLLAVYGKREEISASAIQKEGDGKLELPEEKPRTAIPLQVPKEDEMQEDIAEFVKENPSIAAQLIKSWMLET